jgi:hypothetical protein
MAMVEYHHIDKDGTYVINSVSIYLARRARVESRSNIIRYNHGGNVFYRHPLVETPLIFTPALYGRLLVYISAFVLT